jgi:peptidoglycan-associated lipoprotein
MTRSLPLSHRHLSTALLAVTLALSAGCAAKPKTVPPVAGTTATPSAAARSEAAPTTIAPPAEQASRPSAPQTLPPIAPAQEFSEGAQAGLAPVARAANAGVTTPQVAATLGEAGDRIFFLTDRHDLTDEARTILARQAAWISANPGKRVIIAGSADERGTREYNLALGSRRASAARDYLVSLGVNAASIETLSYGKERPLDARSNPDGWAINRNSLTQLLD